MAGDWAWANGTDRWVDFIVPSALFLLFGDVVGVCHPAFVDLVPSQTCQVVGVAAPDVPVWLPCITWFPNSWSGRQVVVFTYPTRQTTDSQLPLYCGHYLPIPTHLVEHLPGP